MNFGIICDIMRRVQFSTTVDSIDHKRLFHLIDHIHNQNPGYQSQLIKVKFQRFTTIC